MTDNRASVESYLPKISDNPTLGDLLAGYGKYWSLQPSLSAYKRHYSISPNYYGGPPEYHTATPKNFVVWEGYPGHYDAYGDFEDDDAFYNESVKAYEIFWHLNQETTGAVRSWGAHSGQYASLKDLRAAMISQWPLVQPYLGEQGEGWKSFIARHRPDAIAILTELGKEWVKDNPLEARYYKVYPIENYVYLVRWTGERDAVWPPLDYDPKQEGHPKITWVQVQTCSVFRVALKRLPIRFALEEAHTYKPNNLRMYYSYVDGASSIKIVQALKSTLKEKLPEIKFTS